MMSKKIFRHGFRGLAALFLAVLQLFAVIPMNPASADECPLYGTHQYNGELQFEAAHPHKEYYLCDCGYAKYTGTNRDYYENCEICNCDHSSETRSLWDTQTRRYDESYHVIVKVYDVICQNCGTFLRYDEEPEYVAHTWSADGKCTVCNYECEHPSETTRVVDTQIRQYDENEHEYVNILEVVCHVCGKFDRWDEETDHYEQHTFDANGKCTKCGYEKPADECPVHGTHQFGSEVQYEADHPHKEYYVCDCGWAEYTGTNHSFTTTANPLSPRYEKNDENGHTVINIYEDVCDLCGQVVNPGREEPAPDKEAHEFDANGTCIKCGYEKPADECPVHGTHQFGEIDYEAAHPHKEFRKCDCGYAEYTGTNHSFTTTANALSPRYEKYDENGHTVINIYEDVCDLCGQVVNPGREEPAPGKEAHEFDADGTCTKCGYEKPPVEPGQLQISVSPTQSTAKIGETISASATASGGDGSYKYFWEVFKDGSSVDSTDFNMGGYYSYIANETGTYVFTATVKDGTGATASVSGAEILVTCDHANTETTEVGAPVYVNNGSSGHTRIINVHIECLDCGEVLEEKKAISEEQPHEFIDGVCVCGQPEHVHNFVNNNDFEAEHHDGLGHKMYEVCDCGATRYTGEYTQWAECCECVGHDWSSPYDGGNGTWYHKCSRCGAEEETENTCNHEAQLVGTSTSYKHLTSAKHKKIITSVFRCKCGKVDYTEENIFPEEHAWGDVFIRADRLYHKCTLCGVLDVTSGSINENEDEFGEQCILTKEFDATGSLIKKTVIYDLTNEILEITTVYKRGKEAEQTEIRKDPASGKVISKDLWYYNGKLQFEDLSFDDFTYSLSWSEEKGYTSFIADGSRIGLLGDVAARRYSKDDYLRDTAYHDEVMKKLKEEIDGNELFDKEAFAKQSLQEKEETLKKITELIAKTFNTKFKKVHFSTTRTFKDGVSISGEAMYSPKNDNIYVFLGGNDCSLDFVVPSIAHELRHAVQYDIKDTWYISDGKYNLDNKEGRTYKENLIDSLVTYWNSDYDKLDKTQKNTIVELCSDIANQLDIPGEYRNAFIEDIRQNICNYKYVSQPCEVDAFAMENDVRDLLRKR